MYKRLAVALLAVLAIAVVAAGCGGGGSSSSSTAGSTEATESGTSTESSESSESTESGGGGPTKAAFIKEADTICSKANAKLSEEITEYAEEKNISTEKEPSKEQQVEIYEAIVLPNLAKQGEDLAALTPPAGEEEKVEEITDTLSKEIGEAEEDPSSLNEGSLAGAAEKAQAYGFKTCGS